jgi:hypothetical protein
MKNAEKLRNFTFRLCHKSTVNLDLNQQKKSVAAILFNKLITKY